ncbi:hypothetical protein SDC9_156383 [bioreactor metagenome]|uniref:Uncharacterized protein n=1 Tax=bioreactor metagenome TaxID=1076179 RepID=A0A645F439_9ZZZZ
MDLQPLDLLDLQLNQPVVDEHPAAGGKLGVEVAIGHRNAGLVAHYILGGKRKELAGLQGDRAGGKAPDSDFRSLGVHNGGHRAVKLIPHPLEFVEHGQVAFVISVGEVKSGGIHSAEDKRFYCRLVPDRGSEGTDDFCFSHKTDPYLILICP